MQRLLLLLISYVLTYTTLAQNHSVDHATGTLRVSIPLFAISDGDLSVGGALGYAASGVRMTDDGGWVGQNWYLSSQSYGISRQMRSLPDDYLGTSPDTRKGWLRNTNSLPLNIKNFIPTTDNNATTCSDELTNYNFLNGIGYDQDTEPDVFNVNAPGLSFQFYFDENKAVQVVPYEDVQVVPNTVTGTITSFVVTDSKGVQYKFEELETMMQSVQTANIYYQVRQSKLNLTSMTYHTGWKLTKMISPVYGTIDFTYRTVTSSDNNLTPDKSKLKYQFPVTFTNATSANGSLQYNRSYVFKVPLKISAPAMEVQFVSSTNDGTAVGQLSNLDVFDKASGTAILKKRVQFNYYSANGRSFLVNIIEQGNSQNIQPHIYSFEYYGGIIPSEPNYPSYNSSQKDDWSFFKTSSGTDHSIYDDTALRGTLKSIRYPEKGYSVFFYEPHNYSIAGAEVKGAGIRVRKTVTFDGVSIDGDIVKEYQYKTAAQVSSGKLQHLPAYSISGARVDKYWSTVGARYRDVLLANPGINIMTLDGYFTVRASEELSVPNLVSGSAVAYERVVEKVLDGGYSVYEFDLPASYGDVTANNNEWEATKTLIARPSTGSSACFETGPVSEGINKYPYPPHPNYDFAKPLLSKVTSFRDDDVKRKEVIYEYQRVYGGTGIRKIYGLALEELPTYYHNGTTYVDSKMFVYGKYAINTDVKTVLKKTTETFFASSDLAKKVTSSTELFYSTGNHREIERVETVNSDQTVSKTKFKYVKDYNTGSAADAATLALKNLQTARRNALVVESITTKTIAGIEKTIGGNLTHFQVINGKAYPHKVFSFISNDGTTVFTPSSSNGSTFTNDGNYVLQNTYLSFDAFGNAKEISGIDKTVSTIIVGYVGALPIINMQNAKAGEFIFSDFETTSEVAFSAAWNPALIAGRHGSKAVSLPSGTSGPNFLVKGVTNASSQSYIFSCWLKPSAAGTLSIKITGNVTATTSLPFSASTSWKYYAVSVPIPATMTSTGFSVEVRTSLTTPIDDVAFYPSQATFQTSTYAFPFGVSIQTDSQGNTAYFNYDDIGRVKTVYDRDGNLISKNDYQLKP